MARGYDFSPEGQYTRPHKALLLQEAVIRDGDSILDVACGNGYLLGELCRKANVNAYGVDISPNMIAVARERCPHGTFTVSPCTPLPFEDQCMDVITVSCAFHHFEAPQAFAGECMRVLKGNGRLYIAEPWFPAGMRWLANHLLFPFTRSGDVKVYGPKQLRLFFQKAGFQDLKTRKTGDVLFLSARKEPMRSPGPITTQTATAGTSPSPGTSGSLAGLFPAAFPHF